MIEVRGVTKRYGAATVVDDVTLDIAPGGIVALIGPNGAGKSTLLSQMARLLPLDAGTVTVDGSDITRTPGRELARKVSILRQDEHHSARLTVRDLVAFGRYPHSGGRLGDEDEAHIERALDFLDLGPVRDRYLDRLSGGQRQRARVAMVLAQDTRYVLLDEPLNDLDMRHAARLMHMLRRSATELERTFVVVLHDINVAAVHADRIVAMREGKVVADGSPAEIMRSDVLAAVFEMDIPVHELERHRIGFWYRS